MSLTKRKIFEIDVQPQNNSSELRTISPVSPAGQRTVAERPMALGSANRNRIGGPRSRAWALTIGK